MEVSVDREAGAPRDYFDLFQLPADFDLDPEDLSRRFKLLQKQFHPDRFAGKPPAEQRVAAQLCAELNAGFNTLRDEVKRAGFMLERQGIDLKSLEREPVEGDFLLQQIELREAASALLASEQEEANTKAVSALHDSAKGLYDQWLAAFRQAITEDQVEVAGQAWVKLLYISKLRAELPPLGAAETS